MELYIGGTAQGKKAYVTQVRGIEEARIWDNFEEWFREKLQESAPKSLSPEAESMAYLEKHPNLHAVAIAFELQMYRELPFEEHDIKPEKVVTEKQSYPLDTEEKSLI